MIIIIYLTIALFALGFTCTSAQPSTEEYPLAILVALFWPMMIVFLAGALVGDIK